MASGWRVRGVLVVVGSVGAMATAVLWWRVSYTGPFLWEGGFLVAAVSTAAVLACVVCVQRSWLAAALSVAPLRYLGRISYGMYLWHFPLFQWIDGERTGLTGYPLFGVRCMVTVVVATASFYLVERPIRQGYFFRQWRAWVVTPIAVVGVAAIVVVATASSGAVAAAGVGRAATTTTVSGVPAGRPVKVLVIGDSTALTLALNLSVDASAYGLTVKDEGVVGCGVTEGTLDKATGVVGNVWNACNSRVAPGTPLFQYTPAYGKEIKSPDAEQWTVWDRDWIDQYDPDVVVLLAGRWEVHTRVYDGQWTNIDRARLRGLREAATRVHGAVLRRQRGKGRAHDCAVLRRTASSRTANRGRQICRPASTLTTGSSTRRPRKTREGHGHRPSTPWSVRAASSSRTSTASRFGALTGSTSPRQGRPRRTSTRRSCRPSRGSVGSRWPLAEAPSPP